MRALIREGSPLGHPCPQYPFAGGVPRDDRHGDRPLELQPAEVLASCHGPGHHRVELGLVQPVALVHREVVVVVVAAFDAELVVRPVRPGWRLRRRGSRPVVRRRGDGRSSPGRRWAARTRGDTPRDDEYQNEGEREGGTVHAVTREWTPKSLRECADRTDRTRRRSIQRKRPDQPRT